MTPHREIRCPPTGTSPVRGQGDELSAHKEIPLSVDSIAAATEVRIAEERGSRSDARRQQ
jgi:hypothetical protein